MSDYVPPLKDMRFVIKELIGLKQFEGLQGLEQELTAELVDQVLDAAGKFAAEVLAPLNRIGDTVGAKLSDGAVQLLDSLPVAAKKVRDNLKARSGSASPIDTVQKAAAHIEQAANDNTTQNPPRRGVQRVVVERPPFNVRDYLWSGTMGLMSALGQFTVVIFLTYFALASGNLFRNKSRAKSKAELLVFVTPKVMRVQQR